jgi:uncharacterized protein (DUF2141 family)
LRSTGVLLLLLAAGNAYPLLAQTPATLTVHVALNRPAQGGTVRIALCPTKEAYDSEKGCAVLAVRADANVVTATFTDVVPGTCAIKVFHDANNNGVLDTSWIGWPQEAYGFSNDAPVGMGPPSFDAAAIEIGPGANSTEVMLRGG